MPLESFFNRAGRCALALMLAGLFACQQSSGDNATAAPAAGETALGGDACRLLTTSEVNAVLPGAKRGKVDKSREQYGISACIWETERTRLVVQYWKSEGGSASEEASGLTLGVVDPLKPGVAKNVRYENVSGVGEQAVAVVETADAQRGILTDVAMLVAQSGDQILVVFASGLARAERDTAIAGLKTLGGKSVKRL
jgi:hypothetical protein